MSNLPVRLLLDSWMITLRGEGKSKATLRVYRTSVEAYLGFSEELTKASVTAWVASMLGGCETATVRVRLTSVKLFAKWLAEEEGFDAYPIISIKPPKLNQKPVPALADAEVRALIEACEKNTLLGRRDRAMITLMAETGLRAGELLSLDMKDISLQNCILLVKGKGGAYRRVKFSASCAAVVDRYVRSRAIAGWVDGPLWVTRNGRLSYKGMIHSLEKRARVAKVEGFHPHRLRHTAAVRWLKNGGSEVGLMSQAGWKSREMIGRYVKTSAEELAAEEFDRLSLGF